MQAKWRITPSLESGCNAGAVLGVARTRGAGGNTPYLNGLLTCNSSWGATHFNLGAVREPGEPTLGTWGIAHEHEFGPVTAHVEAFGQRRSKPTFQVGARMEVAKACRSTAPWAAATTRRCSAWGSSNRSRCLSEK